MPNPPSNKDAEVRARVTAEMYAALSAQADSRGEQLPVIVREAISEYLAKRIGSDSPHRESLLQALNEKPDLVHALVTLGELLKGQERAPVPPTRPVVYGKSKISSASKRDTARKIVDIVKKTPIPKPAGASHPAKEK